MSVITRTLQRERSATALRSLSAYHVGAITIFAAIFVVAALPRLDTDLWWQLFVGRNILRHAAVPMRDFLSYTVPGHAWIDHEWLSEILMYGVYKLGGIKLLLTSFGMVITVTYIILFGLIRLKGVNQVLALTLTLFAATAGIGSWGVRVQVLSLLFTAAYCFALERYRSTAGTEWLIAMAAGMLFWANLHGGFVIGLLLMAIYMVGGLFDRVHGGMSWSQGARAQRPMLWAIGAAFVVTLFNPNTYHQLVYPLRFVAPNAFTNTIQESLAPNFHLLQVLPFELMIIGLVACALLVRRRVSWVDVLLVVTFTHLALQETRNITLWGVVVVPVLAVYTEEAAKPIIARFRHANRSVQKAPLFIANWAILVAVLIATVVLMGRTVNAKTIWASERATYPAAAIAYLNQHHMPGRVFNSYSFGGYMIWKAHPRYRVFIDPRADTVYTGRVLEDYLTVYDGKVGWQGLLREYRIRWVFVEPESPIAQILSETDGWRVQYQDPRAMIIVHGGVKSNA